MARHHVLDVLAFVAEGQHGHVTRAQAADAGIDDVALHRLAASGIIERVEHGVYRFRGTPEWQHASLWVAWLRLDPRRLAADRATDPDAWVSHRSAARLYDLGDLPADVHEFTATRRLQSSRGDVRIHRRRAGLTADEWEVVDGLPATRPQRIVADLLAEHTDGAHVATIATGALRQQLVTRTELTAAVAPYADRFGVSGPATLDYLTDLAGASR
jgi:predicted transcriptional regulator of viral defense system